MAAVTATSRLGCAPDATCRPRGALALAPNLRRSWTAYDQAHVSDSLRHQRRRRLVWAASDSQ